MTPEGRSALHVQFPASKSADLTEQLLVLPPGDYRLTGRVASDGLSGQLSWRLECVGPGGVLMQLSQGANGRDWQAFSSTFSVPKTGCPGQWFRLTSVPGDGFDAASVWYQAFELSPIGDVRLAQR